MTIAIYGSRSQDDNKEAIAAFIEFLHSRGVKVIVHNHFYTTLMQLIPESMGQVGRVFEDVEFSADVAVSFGGDGTFLRTAMWVGSKEIPILGVNTGHLGYLTTARIDDLDDVARELMQGRYTVEHRSVIEVVSPRLRTWPFALNEVVVNKYETSSMVRCDTMVDGRPLASYRADGLIVSTPTGSTAYSLSVGGPLIQPSVPVWVLSPIAAHSLSLRPLVVSDDQQISVTVDSRATGFRLTLDGRTGTLPVGTTVELRKAPFCVNVICREGYEFPTALRTKLCWGV